MTKPTVAMPLTQPTPELRGRRIQHVINTINAHQYRALLDPTRCACGEPVADGVTAMQRHAVEQLLIAMPEQPIVEVPADADLIDSAVQAVLEDPDANDPGVDHAQWWRRHVVRMHTAVHGPLITALVDELRSTGLGWETLAGLYGDMVDEHAQERDSLRNERDHLRVELAARNKAYGRASGTIGELRAQLAYQRDLRFEANNKRGLAVADLLATRMQVERQRQRILLLLNRVRELGGTVDDVELLGPAETAPAAAGVNIQ